MLCAYFDASYGGPKPTVTSVAGYLASATEWDRVTAQWENALSYWRIDSFHITDIRNNFRKDKAQSCLEYFTDIIHGSQLAAVGAALLDVDWERPDWGADKTKRRGTTYEQCLNLALEVLGNHVEERSPTEYVTVTCCTDAPERKIQSIVEENRSRFPQIRGLLIGTGRQHVGLQCADLGVSQLRRSWRAIATGDAAALSWGDLPQGRGVKGRTSFWSLRQGAVILRSLEIQQHKQRAKQAETL